MLARPRDGGSAELGRRRPIEDALQTISMLGYALLGLAVFGLLRRRFGTCGDLAGAVSCLLLPPMYRWSLGPVRGLVGVLLETLGLLALVLMSDRGPRWLWLWIATMLALSLTRDATIVLMLAAVTLLVVQRRDLAARRRNLSVVATGALAALPFFVLGGVPLRNSLAYVLSGSRAAGQQLELRAVQLSGPGAVHREDAAAVSRQTLGRRSAGGVRRPRDRRRPGPLGRAAAVARGRVLADAQGAVADCVLLLLAANTPQEVSI